MKLLGVATPTPGHETPRTLNQLADQLNVGFHVYRMLIKNEIKASDLVQQEATRLVLNEIHDRMSDFWGMTFIPKIRDGYRVNAPDLSDDFVSAAAGRFSGRLSEQINDVSDRAFIEGYNAALNKGWDRAVAWQKIADAWGLDPVQMRAWITYYPEEGYHGGIHPEKAQKQLDDLLTVRAERISEHEARTIVNLGQQAEWTAKQSEGQYKHLLKVYHTAEDELVCDVCGPLDGIAVELNDQFAGFFMPPLHINCRCSVTLMNENSITKRDNRPLKRSGPSAVQVQAPPVKPQKTEIAPYEVPEVIESEFEKPQRQKQVTRQKPRLKPAVEQKPTVRQKQKPTVRQKQKSEERYQPADPRVIQSIREALTPRRRGQAAALNQDQHVRTRTRSREQVAVHTPEEHEAKMQRRQEARQRQVEQWRSEVRQGVRNQQRQSATPHVRQSAPVPTQRLRYGNVDWATVQRQGPSRSYATADTPRRQYVAKSDDSEE